MQVGTGMNARLELCWKVSLKWRILSDNQFPLRDVPLGTCGIYIHDLGLDIALTNTATTRDYAQACLVKGSGH